jgi:hypothetical protein
MGDTLKAVPPAPAPAPTISDVDGVCGILDTTFDVALSAVSIVSVDR